MGLEKDSRIYENGASGIGEVGVCHPSNAMMLRDTQWFIVSC